MPTGLCAGKNFSLANFSANRYINSTKDNRDNTNGFFMKHSGFLLFFTIVFAIYGLINYYIIRRSWQALAGAGAVRTYLLVALLLLVLTYPAGRILERVFRGWFSEALVITGSFYLAIMVYAFFALVIIDFLRAGNSLFHYFPTAWVKNPLKIRHTAFAVTAGTVAVIVLVGHLNALFPRVRTLDITLPKSAGKLKSLNIVMASDIHLGTIIRNSRLLHLVEMMNSLRPDIVLLPGDVVDEDVGPVIRQNMDASFRKLRARYGVYAITGNHEYFGGVREAVAYLQRAGITVLQDSAVKIADSFYLIGRKDLMAVRMEGGRKSLADILSGVDKKLPLILMDHQPFHLEEAQQNGIDLQLSGHTHHGQLFPFNWITNRVYEKSWGYLRRGATQYYVSCGVGTWGPPIRLGNRPEIVQILVTFRPDSRTTN